MDDDAMLEQFLAALSAMSADERAAVLFGREYRRCPRTGSRVQEPWGRRYAGAVCLIEFDLSEQRRTTACPRVRGHDQAG